MSLFLTRLLPMLLTIASLLVVVDVSNLVQHRLLAGTAAQPATPPLTPRWAYEPWVWEDEENTADSTLALVDGYRELDIPVGVVIVDSPWQTNYNTFEFHAAFPDPAGLVRSLHDRDVRVILWTTGMVNVETNDGPNRGQSPNYQEALERGFLVSGGQVYEWDKGRGSAIDFFNPDAVAWWYAQMDKAWAYGIDGWKVDAPEGNLTEPVLTAAGPKTNREYGTAYYRAYYQYVAQRRPDAIITARPVDSGTVYAPVDANPAGWVGDQEPDWGRRGIEEALENMLASAELGYAVVGSDIGGYRPGPRFDRLFTRWTQLGALSPLMENGGRGEHRPWRLGDDVVRVYQYYATLHHQLVPYLYGLGVDAHYGGGPIIRQPDRARRQYLLGDDLFVAPIVTRDDRRRVELPSGSRWHDYWQDDSVHPGGAVLDYAAPVDRVPLFIRAGAIVPMQVSDGLTGHGGPGSAGRLTLLLYPEGESERVVRAAADRELRVETRRDRAGVTVTLAGSGEALALRIKERAAPTSVAVEADGATRTLAALTSPEALDAAAEGWYHDAARGYLWVRLSTTDAPTSLTYRSSP